MDAQAASVRRVAPSQQRPRATRPQLPAVRLGVVSAIALDDAEPAARAAALAPDAGHRVHQREQLRHVVAVGSHERDRHRRPPVAAGQQVVLGPHLAPIDRIGARFSPPCMARTDAESTTARGITTKRANVHAGV